MIIGSSKKKWFLSEDFNWYKSEDIFEVESRKFESPIRPRHYKMSLFKETPFSRTSIKIPLKQAFKFFTCLPEVYQNLAMTQYFSAGRIGEIAGIQVRNVDLKRNVLTIKESALWWYKSKVFEYLRTHLKMEKSDMYIYMPG